MLKHLSAAIQPIAHSAFRAPQFPRAAQGRSGGLQVRETPIRELRNYLLFTAPLAARRGGKASLDYMSVEAYSLNAVRGMLQYLRTICTRDLLVKPVPIITS